MNVLYPDFPSGSVVQFAGNTAPTGWLLCDGTTYSRALYPALFAAIGVIWGSGDGVNTFHTPDMRGRFPRGRDNAAGRDPDRASRTASNSGGATGDNVGTVQAAQTLSHAHNIRRGGAGSAYDASNGNARGFHGTNADAGYGIFGSGLDAIQANGGNETRPQNANFNFIIKI